MTPFGGGDIARKEDDDDAPGEEARAARAMPGGGAVGLPAAGGPAAADGAELDAAFEGWPLPIPVSEFPTDGGGDGPAGGGRRRVAGKPGGRPEGSPLKPGGRVKEFVTLGLGLSGMPQFDAPSCNWGACRAEDSCRMCTLDGPDRDATATAQGVGQAAVDAAAVPDPQAPGAADDVPCGGPTLCGRTGPRDSGNDLSAEPSDLSAEP